MGDKQSAQLSTTSARLYFNVGHVIPVEAMLS